MSENNLIQLNQEFNLTNSRSELFVENIKKSRLLTTELEKTIVALAPELNHIFKTQTIWRTETEIRCSVLNDLSFPDKASKYHQCKLEQLVFFEQLLYLSFEYRRLQEDLTILEADIEEIEYKLENDELKSFEVKRLKAELEKKYIELEEKSLGVQQLKIQSRERIREIEIWSKIKDELYDESFDKDNRDTNQLLSLARRYIQESFNARQVGKGSDISSFNNIVAQYMMLVKECIARGIFDELMKPFGGPGNVLYDYVAKDFGISNTNNQPIPTPTW